MYGLYSSDKVRTAGIFFFSKKNLHLCNVVMSVHCSSDFKYSFQCMSKGSAVKSQHMSRIQLPKSWFGQQRPRTDAEWVLLLRVPGLTALGNSSREIKYNQTIPNIKCIMKNTWEAWGESMIKNLGWFLFFAFYAGYTSWSFRPWIGICTKENICLLQRFTNSSHVMELFVTLIHIILI